MQAISFPTKSVIFRCVFGHLRRLYSLPPSYWALVVHTGTSQSGRLPASWSAQLVDPAIIAKRGRYIVQGQQTLKAKNGRYGIWIGEIMGLYVNMLAKTQRRKLAEIVHRLTLIY